MATPHLRRRGRLLSIAFALCLTAAGCGSSHPTTAAHGLNGSPSAGGSAAAGLPSTSASGSAAPSASASAAASGKPSTRPPTTRSGGKPGPSNTGVPAGTHLTVVSGNQVYATSNKVISGLDIHGYVEITGKNVVLKNSIVRGGAAKCNAAVITVDHGGSATIQDTEVSPSNPNACLDGVWSTSATLLRMNIHGSVDGVKAFDHTVVRDSWIHGLMWFASDPNQGGGPTHNDDVQTFEGNQHITLQHNTLDAGTKGNAAYQVSQDFGQRAADLHVVGNWLDGGGCTLNFSANGGPTPMTGIYVLNNRFGRHSQFDCPILISTQTVLTQNSGNVWDDTGKAIPRPQQHD